MCECVCKCVSVCVCVCTCVYVHIVCAGQSIQTNISQGQETDDDENVRLKIILFLHEQVCCAYIVHPLVTITLSYYFHAYLDGLLQVTSGYSQVGLAHGSLEVLWQTPTSSALPSTPSLGDGGGVVSVYMPTGGQWWGEQCWWWSI